MHRACRNELSCNTLITIFDQEFSSQFNTCLIKGGQEPEYIPASNDTDQHRIIFTKDYFSSALHEIAHWCVAGEKRRLQHDYGYWYEPDGRSAQQQAEFEKVEIKPQALEWLFSEACGIRFRVSADNLGENLGPSDSFKCAIIEQVHHYCDYSFNQRVTLFLKALISHYQTVLSLDELLDKSRYSLDKL